MGSKDALVLLMALQTTAESGLIEPKSLAQPHHSRRILEISDQWCEARDEGCQAESTGNDFDTRDLHARQRTR